MKSQYFIKSVLFSLLFFLSAYNQNIEAVKSLSIIDCPTAATLERGSFLGSLQVYNDGGLLGYLEVGLTNRMMFGISYGGKNLIGSGQVDWNPLVAVNIRYRVIDEALSFPAIAVGYDGQGHGAYLDSLSRFEEKSKGIYVAASKSFNFLGTLAFHGGLNYSFERKDSDKDLNGFVGIEKSLNNELSIFAEYDLAMNDNTGKSIGQGKGYLNAALKWTFQKKLQIDFLWKNILSNNKFIDGSSREIRISYIEYF
ncbi:MAG: YjbH domain-containing protein [Calditrichaeota bacterium]|nr:YjbH domain-containing protein [Calditrichota bacterium]